MRNIFSTGKGQQNSLDTDGQTSSDRLRTAAASISPQESEAYYPLPFDFLAPLIRKTDFSVLLDSSSPGTDSRYSYLYMNPVSCITASRPEEAEEALLQADAANIDGLYLAGYLSYEAGSALAGIPSQDASTLEPAPALWLGVFKEVLVFDHTTGQFCQPLPSWFDPSSLPTIPRDVSLLTRSLAACPGVQDWRHSSSRNEYLTTINKILEAIKNGDVYQVNHTFRLQALFGGDPLDFYALLRQLQPVPWSAYIRLPGSAILSFSPELFFKKAGQKITVRPMKGTASRQTNPKDDVAAGANLAQDPKNRAENSMIVDLLRNDLGRLALVGSVNTSALCAVEQHPTVWQMTSTVSASLPPPNPIFCYHASSLPLRLGHGCPKIAGHAAHIPSREPSQRCLLWQHRTFPARWQRLHECPYQDNHLPRRRRRHV